MEWLTNRAQRESEVQQLQRLVNSQNQQIDQLKKSVELLEARQLAQDNAMKDCKDLIQSVLRWVKVLFWLFFAYAFITI